MHRRLPRRAGVLALLVAGGCADRGVVSAPSHDPSTATWIVVALAVLLAGAVLGAVLLGPPDRRPRLASIVLTVEAGIATVGLAVLVGVALRSWHLAEQQDPEAHPAHSLLRIGGLDGDPHFFRTALLFIGVVGGLALLLLVVAARFAASDDPGERGAACLVLAVELLGALLCAGLLLAGSRWWPILIGAVQVPFVVAALVSCWPTRPGEPVTLADSGYNGRHG